jgi:predicted DCC family thiol-disulfide oxidoreductase YuxK
MSASDYEVEVFFDGACPLCSREIGWLRWMDRRGRIRFTDIADPSFDAPSCGMSWDRLMERIHARLPDGSWIEGVEVFRRLYGAVGFGVLVELTRLRPIARLLDAAYTRFAQNRLRWTGRCDGVCELPAQGELRREGQPLSGAT